MQTSWQVTGARTSFAMGAADCVMFLTVITLTSHLRRRVRSALGVDVQITRGSQFKSRQIALFGCIALAASLSGCSSATARSVSNFCSTYHSEKAKFQAKYAPMESSNPQNLGGTLINLMMGFQSIGDGTVIFTKLNKVAPDDIEPDVKAVLDSWKGMQSTMGDEAANAFNPTGMLGAMFKGILASMESQGSWTRVGDYIQTHCGQ
jgi:hypothetical protein